MTIVQYQAPQTAPGKREIELIRSLPQQYVTLLGAMQPDGRLPMGTTLTDTMRRQMTNEVKRLQEIMGDRRPRDQMKALILVLANFAGQAVSDDGSSMLMIGFDMALEDCPTWAVEEAVRRWITGKLGPKRFAPTPPELRCAVDEVLTLTKGIAVSLSWLAKAEVVEPPSEGSAERLAKLTAIVGTAVKRFNADMTDEQRQAELAKTEALKGKELDDPYGFINPRRFFADGKPLDTPTQETTP